MKNVIALLALLALLLAFWNGSGPMQFQSTAVPTVAASQPENSNEFVERFAGHEPEVKGEGAEVPFLTLLAVALTESPDGMVTVTIRPQDAFGDSLTGVKLGYDPDKNGIPDDERQETSTENPTLSVEVRLQEDMGVWVLIAPAGWCHVGTTYDGLDIIPTYSPVCEGR